MQKDKPWQFERTIKGQRYVGLAWHPDRKWVRAIAALFTLKFEGEMWADLPVRKIPAVGKREEMYLILIPDLLDTGAGFTEREKEIYLWLGREIPEFMEGFDGNQDTTKDR